jgi:RimJ/RimL family protein N-acetyltransferase
MHLAVEIRPLERTDRDRLAAAFARLSPEARYHRFLGHKPELSAVELDNLTQLDYITRDAVVAVERRTGRLVGIARYAIQPRDRATADVAIAIADDWQGYRLGLALSRRLLCRAAGSGIQRLVGEVLDDNVRSRALLRKLGFHQRGRHGSVIEFALELQATE